MHFILTFLIPAALAHGGPECRRWLGDLRTFHGVDRSQRPHNLGSHETWGVDGEMIYEELRYNAFFGPSLDERPLELVARDRHVLDVFGSAVFSREPAAFASLTGLRRRAGISEENISLKKSARAQSQGGVR